jgi:O-antigen/teichoic acid export membrane protein
MKLVDVILLSLAAALIIIGIYEVMAHGIGAAYGIIMLAIICFFIYTLRKRKS